MSESSWEPESGLPDDFAISIEDAAFLKSAEVRNGEQSFLNLSGPTDDGERQEIRILCGPGWDSLDGGKTVVHEAKKKRFNENTHYGLWLTRIKELGILDTLAARGEATEAKVWVGLKFHMKQKAFSGNVNGEDRTWHKILPEAFLGEVGATPAASAPAAAATATNGAANGVSAGDKVLLVKLKAEAKKHDTHEAFVDAAMEIPGVMDSEDILQRVVDEAGLYSEARA